MGEIQNSITSICENIKKGALTMQWGSGIGYRVKEYAYRLWQQLQQDEQELPDSFVWATELAPKDHLKMQALLQQYIDNSISMTINIPEGFPFSSFKKIYENAYHNGLKGCTTFRPNPTTGSVLKTDQEKSKVHSCTLEREAG